jgi:hypothetical protein
MINSLTLLTNSISDLWYWTYGIIAGWGLTLTIMIAAIVVLAVRQIRLQKQITQLENRIVHNEREFNSVTKTWPGKTTKN